MFQRIVLILVIIASVGCQPTEMASPFTAQTMGTYVQITTSDEAAAEKAISAIQAIDSMMSLYKPDSELSQLNRIAKDEFFSTSPELFKLINRSIYYYNISNGAFDITAAPLVDLWGFFKKEKLTIPSKEDIANTMVAIGSSKIKIDEEKSLVHFTKPGMKIDLGAVAKGYAVDKAIDSLKQTATKSALVDLAGNIRVLGLPNGREFWSLGVRDPRVENGVLGRLRLTKDFPDWALASSGQYEQFFIADGKRYGHIIDPRSGYPAEGILGTTILASSAMAADVLSTATFVMGSNDAMLMIRDLPNAHAIIIIEDAIYISEELLPVFDLAPEHAEMKLIKF